MKPFVSGRALLVAALLVAVSEPGRAVAQTDSGGVAGQTAPNMPAPVTPAARESLTDAWWTGPMLAASGATLPHGHFLVEPYLYDVTAPRSNGFGTLSYVLYGLLDQLTVGTIPTATFNAVVGGPSSSRVGLGDITAVAQYRLTQFRGAGWIPTASLVLEETFPTGKYDRLGDRPSDGVGSGAYTTTVGVYSQTYVWLPNGRILRTRLDVSEALAGDVSVRDVSVYGTGAGFRGLAAPGSSFYADASAEYSVTRNWVVALDVPYRNTASTNVTGSSVLDLADAESAASIRRHTATSEAFGVAPAIEYNVNPTLGVLLGVRAIASGHNTTRSITPAIAVNIVR